MGQRRIEFDAQSLLRLLTHYFQDHEVRIPLDSELLAAGVSPYINRWIMLEIRSKEWTEVNTPINIHTHEPEFIHVRYEGKKTMSWGNDGQAPIEWREAVEAPTK